VRAYLDGLMWFVVIMLALGCGVFGAVTRDWTIVALSGVVILVVTMLFDSY
jgi:hypothetical protein